MTDVMTAPCEATSMFANAAIIPPCRRPATHVVAFMYADVPYRVRSCEPCTVLLTVHKPSLKATVEVRDV